MDNETSKELITTSNKQVVVRHDDVNLGLRVLNLLDDKQLAQAELFLKKIIATDKGGIKSVNEGLAVLMRAQDLQLPFSTCIEHIHVINGKTAVDVHIIKALLSRAGVIWKCTKDYAPQYQYTDGNTIYLETQLPQYCVKCRTPKEAESKTTDDVIGVYPVKWYSDLKGNVYNEFQIPKDKCVVALNKAHAAQIVKDGKFPILRIPAQPIDYVTEYEFTRYYKVDGKTMINTCVSRFSLNDAQQADLLGKDAYKKYPRVLVGHRAFTLGARDIAADMLMGVMETTEAKIVNNIDLDDADYIDIN